VFHAPRRIAAAAVEVEVEVEGGGRGQRSEAAAATKTEAKVSEPKVAAARWFGEEAVVDSWLHALVKALDD
jgi:hypothetical protein